MTKHISKYVVYIEEDEGQDVSDILQALPGYVEHEWLDWTDA